MEEEKKNAKKNARRSFLQAGLLAGALALLGLKSTRSSPEGEDGEMIKMQTAEGKLGEVPKKILPKGPGRVVSNEELRKWVNDDKK